MNIVLGGTSGLGEKIVEQLRSHNKDTLVVGSHYDEFNHGKGMKIDLSDLDDVEKMISHIREMGEVILDSFYWVAGYGYKGNFADQSDVMRMGNVNYSHVIPIAQAAWQKMIQQDSGDFVVIRSTSGIRPRSDEAAYVGTKFAQEGFARSLGKEAERLGSNIHVSLFEPGGMQTSFYDPNNLPEGYDTYLNPEKVAWEIVNDVRTKTGYPYERMIERGSL